MSRPYLQCDVFAGRPGAGNPLAVVLDADALSDEQMQTIAHDIVTYVPLGQAFPNQGLAANLDGFIESPVPFFWNVQRKH